MYGRTRQQTMLSMALTALCAGVMVGGGALVFAPGASATHVDPVLVEGNASCPEGTTPVKIENPSDGDSGSDGDFEVSIGVDGAAQTLDFTATGGTVLVAIVKGGPDSNLYDYRPAGTTADSGLHAPENENTPQEGDFYGLSHVSFCFGQPTTPPTETPPTTPPTETPPTDTPPTDTPPTDTPPTDTPPTDTPPTQPPATTPPPAPPTDFPAGVDAAGGGGADDGSGSVSWWPVGLIGAGAVLVGGAAFALRRRGDHHA